MIISKEKFCFFISLIFILYSKSYAMEEPSSEKEWSKLPSSSQSSIESPPKPSKKMRQAVSRAFDKTYHQYAEHLNQFLAQISNSLAEQLKSENILIQQELDGQINQTHGVVSDNFYDKQSRKLYLIMLKFFNEAYGEEFEKDGVEAQRLNLDYTDPHNLWFRFALYVNMADISLNHFEKIYQEVVALAKKKLNKPLKLSDLIIPQYNLKSLPEGGKIRKFVKKSVNPIIQRLSEEEFSETIASLNTFTMLYTLRSTEHAFQVAELFYLLVRLFCDTKQVKRGMKKEEATKETFQNLSALSENFLHIRRRLTSAWKAYDTHLIKSIEKQSQVAEQDENALQGAVKRSSRPEKKPSRSRKALSSRKDSSNTSKESSSQEKASYLQEWVLQDWESPYTSLQTNLKKDYRQPSTGELAQIKKKMKKQEREKPVNNTNHEEKTKQEPRKKI